MGFAINGIRKGETLSKYNSGRYQTKHIVSMKVTKERRCF
jgi:hypothetical protein